MIEIERKYLVKSDDFKSVFSKKSDIAQGYLSSVAERTVRVRIKGEKGFLTIKGIGNETEVRCSRAPRNPVSGVKHPSMYVI
jgi:adenylate cyclase